MNEDETQFETDLRRLGDWLRSEIGRRYPPTEKQMAAVRAAGRRKFERGQRRREAEQANCTVKGDKKVEEPTKPTEKPKPDQKSKSEDYGQDQGF